VQHPFSCGRFCGGTGLGTIDIVSEANRPAVGHHALIFARPALLAVALMFAGCGGGASARACPDAITGTPERTPPPELAFPAGAHVYVSEGPFGKTERFYAVVDGTVDDLESMRDTATQALLDAGFTLLTKDAEPPIEAEGHVDGKRMVSVQVTELCDGKLRLRYTVS
jgi:hypothetical protein